MKTMRTDGPRLALEAETAADLMSTNPVSISADALVREAIGLLVDKGFGAAPVIDEAGRPVGVVSRSDILVHERERDAYLPVTDEFVSDDWVGSRLGKILDRGFNVVDVDRTSVGDIMTPAVFSVVLDTPAHRVVAEMLDLKVHQIFVVDDKGVLVGVVSTHDILRHLRPDMPRPRGKARESM